MRNREDILDAVNRYGDMVLRACAVHLRQQADRDDAFQETFIRYAQCTDSFSDEEHRKAWLLRVAINICRDSYRSADNRNSSIDDLEESQLPASLDSDPTHEAAAASELLGALSKIEEKYRTALYLKFYEGYTAVEISEMLDMPVNTVYTNIARGKEALKEVLTHGRA